MSGGNWGPKVLSEEFSTVLPVGRKVNIDEFIAVAHSKLVRNNHPFGKLFYTPSGERQNTGSPWPRGASASPPRWSRREGTCDRRCGRRGLP
ncbi:hypothetical protein KSX_71390 [Ktedonospora formicarum]|uniref:Uncharacterized protein n=1 Tax=Ktedonospora formicarum TaxID=2778364 RepID=A0A8J3I7N4_9CHLR|nr:hypothetical protein KSX_71390 [Ktedonospora formicarum]